MQYGILVLFNNVTFIITTRRNTFRKKNHDFASVYWKGSSDETFKTGSHVSNIVVTESVDFYCGDVANVPNINWNGLYRDSVFIEDTEKEMFTGCDLLGFYYYRIYTI